jgi:hypothetical protein
LATALQVDPEHDVLGPNMVVIASSRGSLRVIRQHRTNGVVCSAPQLGAELLGLGLVVIVNASPQATVTTHCASPRIPDREA